MIEVITKLYPHGSDTAEVTQHVRISNVSRSTPPKANYRVIIERFDEEGDVIWSDEYRFDGIFARGQDFQRLVTRVMLHAEGKFPERFPGPRAHL